MNTEKTLRHLTPEATINQISTDQNAATLLNSIGMKTEKYQGQTLRSVCQQLQWNEEELLAWIKQHHPEAEGIEKEQIEIDTAKDDDIIKWSSRLTKTMKSCSRLLNEISRDLPRIQLVHGNQYTWLKNIEWHFNTLNEQLNLYLSLEDETLLPLAKELNERKESILYGKVRGLKRALKILEGDRPKIQKEMDKIRELSDGFKHPAGACSTLRIMNKNLADLSVQLKIYFSVEEEHLFPLIKDQLYST